LEREQNEASFLTTFEQPSPKTSDSDAAQQAAHDIYNKSKVEVK